MGFATPTLKYVVFIFNAMIAGLCLLILAFNVIVMLQGGSIVLMISTPFIPLAVVLLIVSFFGWFGAIRENTCCLWTYVVFLILIIVANVAIIATYSSNHDVKERQAQEKVDLAWEQMLNFADSMEHLEYEFGCCGKNGVQDYIAAKIRIPQICYYGSNSTDSSDEATTLYRKGCLYPVTESYTRHEKLPTALKWTSLSVEIVTLIATCVLAIRFRNEKRRALY